MKRQKMKSNINHVVYQCSVDTSAYPKGSQQWSLFLIRHFIISLGPRQGAGWLAGLPGVITGANRIRMLGPHLSVVMAG